MKNCGRCGKENTDEMRFCLECGNALPDAPIVINFGDDPARTPADAATESFGQSVKTQIGNRHATADHPTAVTANRPRRSNTKIFLAAGGILALLALLFTGVAAIVVYNLISQQPERADLTPPTPTPKESRPVEKDLSPTPGATATPVPRASKTPAVIEDDPDVTVKFDGVEVDYNVRENGLSGMRMRVTFTVTGMKNTDSYLAIHFQNKDGEPLPAEPGEYRDVNGNLAVFRSLRPDYEETEYKNLELFLPYDEFDLTKGRHELKMDFDLLDGKGVTIEHLAFNDFWYEQK